MQREFNENEFFRFAKSYLSEAFPNPRRLDCPPDAELSGLAEHPRKTDPFIPQHLTCCSPCFHRYMEILAGLKAKKAVICQVDHDLLDSLSTQTARTHFQALAHNYPILNHFDSPADVLTQLREHEDVEVVNHHRLERNPARTGEVHCGRDWQQLLLLAFMPAIHRSYAEVCQRFPALSADDIAQQASLVFLEAARTSFVISQNGYLPVALSKEFRRRLFCWAFNETRRSVPSEEISVLHPEPPIGG